MSFLSPSALCIVLRAACIPRLSSAGGASYRCGFDGRYSWDLIVALCPYVPCPSQARSPLGREAAVQVHRRRVCVCVCCVAPCNGSMVTHALGTAGASGAWTHPRNM